MRFLLRSMLLTGGLAAAALGPALFFSASEGWSQLQSALPLGGGTTDRGADEVLEGLDERAAVPAELAPFLPAELPPEGVPARDLEEVFRFDRTPGWVAVNWPRVSTGLGQLPLHGYRVPLVTGTGEDDLAGALTYYFGPQQQLERITFYGTTGNVNRLIHLLVSQHRFTRRPTNDAGLFLYEAADPSHRVVGSLRIRSAPVLRADDPLGRFEIALDMRRSGA